MKNKDQNEEQRPKSLFAGGFLSEMQIISYVIGSAVSVVLKNLDASIHYSTVSDASVAG